MEGLRGWKVRSGAWDVFALCVERRAAMDDDDDVCVCVSRGGGQVMSGLWPAPSRSPGPPGHSDGGGQTVIRFCLLAGVGLPWTQTLLTVCRQSSSSHSTFEFYNLFSA